jgi:hypothetical protein
MMYGRDQFDAAAAFVLRKDILVPSDGILRSASEPAGK